MRQRRRFSSPSHATIVAYLALFVALGGSSYAITSGRIDGRLIDNGSITSKDIKAHSIVASRLSPALLASIRGSCPADTTREGRICATALQPAQNWTDAWNACAQRGLRLPSISEAHLPGVAGGWTDDLYREYNSQTNQNVSHSVLVTPSPLSFVLPVSDSIGYTCVTDPVDGG